jgi:hypothetical protein
MPHTHAPTDVALVLFRTLEKLLHKKLRLQRLYIFVRVRLASMKAAVKNLDSEFSRFPEPQTSHS